MNETPAISPTPTGRRLKRGKILAFTVIIFISFFGGLEMILALFGVKPLLSTEDPLVGFASNVPLYVEVPQPDGSIMMKTAANKLYLFNDQQFPLIKGKNTYRIFCMGGSTTFGRPYTNKTSFCGWLQQYLRAVAPERNWEVINAGGVSYASYRVAKLMEDLRRYQPDLFIVYTGQNEFLERRSYGKLIDMPEWALDLDSLASNTRTYVAIKDLIDYLNPDSMKHARERYKLSGEVDDILDHTAGPVTYHRDDKLKQQIITHFRLNLERMIKIAHKANAGIIFVTPAVNLKDMSPFKSEHRPGLSTQQLRDWEDLFRRGGEAQEKGEMAQSLDLYRQALAIDDRYADLHFRVGRVLYALKRYDEAEEEFWRAVDEDIAPLRALYSMTRIVPEIAAQNGVPDIDFPGILRKAYLQKYDNAIFGNEYFIDSVHPTIEGYRLLGAALLEQLGKQGLVPAVDVARDSRIVAANERVTASITDADRARALAQLGRLMDWAGKFEEANNLFLQAIKLRGPDPFFLSLIAKTALKRHKPDETINYLTEAVTINPNMSWEQQALANVLMAQGRKKEAVAHYAASLRAKPDDAIVHNELAIALAELGESEEALKEFYESVRLRPNYEQNRFNLVVFLIRLHRYDEALKQTQVLLDMNPNDFLALDSLGVILANQGKFDAAVAQFNEALRINPNYLTARENLRKVIELRDRAAPSSSLQDTDALRLPARQNPPPAQN